MRFIVTGGSGFIGSAVIRKIISDTKNEVLNIDKLTYAANQLSLAEVCKNDRYQFYKQDICNFQDLNELIKEYKPDIILHLAAETHVDRSIVAPNDFINTNIIGTYNLLEASRIFWQSLDDNKQELFKFIYVSTDEVFGELPHPNFSKLKKLPLFNEDSNYAPSSPYSASKAGADHLVKAWNRTYKLPTIITNCSNNYGPYQNYEKLIPMIISNAIQGKQIPIYGDGLQIRDWLFVDDHADALLKIAFHAKPGSRYNIGGKNEKKNIEVSDLICGILDKIYQGPDSFKNQITFVEDRPGHDLRYAIDSTKICKDLGWTPKESFSSGIEKTILWYLNNLQYLGISEPKLVKSINNSIKL
tara:strand:+ start:3506 stop:4579 length:1074 start_codon:yes stop_codon:yes gene_type:complete